MDGREFITIGEVARRVGLTERSLRFYEEAGLIAPMRAPSGQRRYRPCDVERLMHIRLLKRAGFNLGAIKALLDGAPATRRVVDVHIAELRAERERIDVALSALKPLKDAADGGGLGGDGGMSLDLVCKLINVAEQAGNSEAWRRVYERYFTPEQLAEWEALSAQALEGVDLAAYHFSWTDFMERVKAALPLDPASKRAQDLLDEFDALKQPFSDLASPEQKAADSAFWRRVGEWGEEVGTPWTEACSDFVQAAKAARAGKPPPKNAEA